MVLYIWELTGGRPSSKLAMMNRKRLMALSGVLAFVLVIGAVAVVAARNGDSAGPAPNLPKLAYGTGAAGQDQGGMQASLAPAFPVTYEVRGTLPALSDAAPAYTVKADTSRDRINRVAAALGVPVQGQPGGTPGVTDVVGGRSAALALVAYLAMFVTASAALISRRDVA